LKLYDDKKEKLIKGPMMLIKYYLHVKIEVIYPNESGLSDEGHTCDYFSLQLFSRFLEN